MTLKTKLQLWLAFRRASRQGARVTSTTVAERPTRLPRLLSMSPPRHCLNYRPRLHHEQMAVPYSFAAAGPMACLMGERMKWTVARLIDRPVVPRQSLEELACEDFHPETRQTSRRSTATSGQCPPRLKIQTAHRPRPQLQPLHRDLCRGG